MNLKGWPFELLDGEITPSGEGSGGSPCPLPG